MKSLTIYIPIIALFIIGALALYGSASGNKIVLKDAGAARAASGKSGEQALGAVNIDEFDKTGICADFETVKSEAECKAGTVEKAMPLDSETSVVFQNVCETGLHEPEIGPSGKEYPYSIRNTLNIYLENKNTRERECIYSYKCNYTDFIMGRLGHEGSATHNYNYPFVLDAIVSNDGKLLRFIVYGGDLELLYLQIDLRKKDWAKQIEEHSLTTVYQGAIFPSGGGLLQAYFVKPDVINVFTTTMDYSVRIKSEDNKLYKLKHNIPLTRKYPKRVTYCDCIYWNGKGDYEYIRSLFLHKRIFDEYTGSYTMADDFSEPIGKELPVPAQKDWEGWHKLEKNTK